MGLKLKVRRLRPEVKLPTVAYAGSDLGYDVYLPDDVRLVEGITRQVPLGIALEMEGHGFLMFDRSSLAARGISISGGVIDAGYRGEISAVLTLSCGYCCNLKKGDKVAQLVPLRSATLAEIVEAEDLSASSRGDKGFGSSGR